MVQLGLFKFNCNKLDNVGLIVLMKVFKWEIRLRNKIIRQVIRETSNILGLCLIMENLMQEIKQKKIKKYQRNKAFSKRHNSVHETELLRRSNFSKNSALILRQFQYTSSSG